MNIPEITWFPDETFYSLCSRLHVLLGNARLATTRELLFDHPTIGFEHDIPKRVEQFAVKTNERFGAARSIFVSHTICPYYWVLQRESHEVQIEAASDHCAGVAFKANRHRDPHPLKFCVECASTDFNAHGCAYWHMDHQLPGVWICKQHLTQLRTFGGKQNHFGGYGAQLPSYETQEGWFPDISTESMHLLERMGFIASGLAGLGRNGSIHTQLLPFLYRQRLGLSDSSGGGSQDIDAASKALFDFLSEISPIGKFLGMPVNLHDTRLFLQGTLWPVYADCNTSHLCVMASWLYPVCDPVSHLLGDLRNALDLARPMQCPKK